MLVFKDRKIQEIQRNENRFKQGFYNVDIDVLLKLAHSFTHNHSLQRTKSRERINYDGDESR